MNPIKSNRLLFCYLAGMIGLLAACQMPGKEAVRIEGIWTGDVHLAERDGQAFEAAFPQAFRFDEDGPGWRCSLDGWPAEVCRNRGGADGFLAREVDLFENPQQKRTRAVQIRGLEQTDPRHLRVSYTLGYDYEYKDGSPGRTTRYTGDAGLVRVDRVEPDESRGIGLLGTFNGFPQEVSADPARAGGAAILAEKLAVNVRVKGSHAFVARYGDGLRVVDVSDPAAMRAVGHAPVLIDGEIYNDVKLFAADGRDYAAMSASRSGLPIYDVTDPAAPTLAGNVIPGLAEVDERVNDHTAFMVGATAYLGVAFGLKPGGGGGLLIVDLADPKQPRELGRWLAGSRGGSYVHDLHVDGGTAYLACWEIGLVALDVRDPSRPAVIGQFTYDRMTSHSVWVTTTTGGRRVAVHGDEDFGGHVRVIDVDPASATFMAKIGEWQLRPEVSVHNIMAAGGEIVMTHYQDGVRVLDVSDPARPQQTAYFNTWSGALNPRNGASFYEGAVGVDVVGDRIYVADTTRGLLVLQRRR